MKAFSIWNKMKISFYPTFIESPLPQECNYSRIEFDSISKCWNVLEDPQFVVFAAALKHRIPSFGFIIEEKSSPGKLDSKKLLDIGITPGPIFGKLKNGVKVKLDSGEELDPADFVGPDVPGRKVAVMGDTCDSSEILPIAQDVDVLVHEATMENNLLEKCVEFGHSTPNMAVDVAVGCKAKSLVLFHLSPRYKPLSLSNGDEDKDTAQIIINQATNHLKEVGRADMDLLVAEDFSEYQILKKK
eukprot:GFUD01094152.1.p1 GENE.GFUD01094152.1~~GFUD01094152.1.p1  ORF type:complete len:244 (+),score=69.96 GFUD01094152.1:368-1099(+)